ncbi:HDOD domain-containing protein [Catenovulum sediminis]|uniref:HDOD domain-containing protein n=1 Tax=Catenovulum sediminis TaxID=1740262 RepID=A0ABV1RL76_9ALTE|nr:HDOD domain-containing protein [Catenovulum sediminis]
MFIRLFKQVLSNIKSTSGELILGGRNKQVDEQEHSMVDQLQLQIDDAFYNVLLGSKDKGSGAKVKAIESAVAAQIETVLEQPELIVNELPVMPHSVASMISMMSSDDFDIQKLLVLIRQEPAVVSSIIATANSPMYKRSEKDVVSLKSAFVQLGSDGIKEAVLMSFIKQFCTHKAAHYQAFGENIWSHAQHSALYARKIAMEETDAEDANVAFIAGMINQLGKMVIFNLIVDAFTASNVKEIPSTKFIKQLIQQRSVNLVWSIAEHWNLPPEICGALENPHRSYVSCDSIAAFVSQGAVISQLEIIQNAQALPLDICMQYADKKLMTTEVSSLLYVVLGKKQE